ncbi:MAG: hypothetical protein V3U92_05125 [Cellulophaga sp.]
METQMSDTFLLASTEEELEEFYKSENVKFKDKARALLIRELGFEPDLRISMNSELMIRSQLKKFSEGIINQNALNSEIELYSNVTRSMIKRFVPEQYHFVKDHKDSSDIPNGVTEMTDNLTMSWQRFEKEYLVENVEFKDEARRILTKELGFEPNLRVSIGVELLLRKTLKWRAEGGLSDEKFNSRIELYANTTRSMIKDFIPEQYHFVKDHKDGSDILNGDG